MKRQSLLVDRYLASQNIHLTYVDKHYLNRVSNDLLEAKRFVLDRQAVSYVADAILDMPDVIAEAQEFAIQPFPKMYVEMPYFKEFWEAIMQDKPYEKHAGDSEIGLLYVNNRVNILAGDGPDSAPSLGPMEYRLHTPMLDIEEMSLCNLMQTSPIGIDMHMWGNSYDKIDPSNTRMLRSHHTMRPVKGIDLANVKGWTTYLANSAGDMRTAVLLLLMLNRTSNVRYDHIVPPQRAMIHNKARTLVSYTNINFNLKPGESLRTIFMAGGGGVWRRQHEVRGHFCHDRTARDARCVHDWQEMDSTNHRQWRCLKCGGLKWWRKAHTRGNESKGFSHRGYNVTAKD